MLLASCASLRLADLPAPLKVEIPTTCEDLLARVDVPLFGPEDDAIKAYLAMEAVAIMASAEIELVRACLIKQRQDYAGKGSK